MTREARRRVYHAVDLMAAGEKHPRGRRRRRGEALGYLAGMFGLDLEDHRPVVERLSADQCRRALEVLDQLWGSRVKRMARAKRSGRRGVTAPSS